jgi:hypothetical protein
MCQCVRFAMLYARLHLVISRKGTHCAIDYASHHALRQHVTPYKSDTVVVLQSIAMDEVQSGQHSGATDKLATGQAALIMIQLRHCLHIRVDAQEHPHVCHSH